MPNPSIEVLKAIAVTTELLGTALSPAAAQVFASELAAYPEMAVLDALRKTQRECKGRLTLADVVSRIDDGRPGPNEAWAMIPTDESASVVWTDEMRSAWGVAEPLMQAGDMIAARMAFIEAYGRAINVARAESRQAKWSVSLGESREGRERAVNEALAKGRISHEQAAIYLPAPISRMPEAISALLPAPAIAASTRERISALRASLGGKGGHHG